MTKTEIMSLLEKIPNDGEVVAFKAGNLNVREIRAVYIGNERFLPNGKRDQPDKIIIEYD